MLIAKPLSKPLKAKQKQLRPANAIGTNKLTKRV